MGDLNGARIGFIKSRVVGVAHQFMIETEYDMGI